MMACYVKHNKTVCDWLSRKKAQTFEIDIKFIKFLKY